MQQLDYCNTVEVLWVVTDQHLHPVRMYVLRTVTIQTFWKPKPSICMIIMAMHAYGHMGMHMAIWCTINMTR